MLGYHMMLVNLLN